MLPHARCILVALAVSFAIGAAASAQVGSQPAAPAPGGVADPGWPRTFSGNGSTVILHQPQIDSWANQATVSFRMAMEVTPAGAAQPDYGVATVHADTHTDSSTGTVVLTNIDMQLGFPGLADAQATTLKELVKDLLPARSQVTISLDRILAYMHDQPPPPPVAVNVAPPPIYYSDSPAILVVFIGPPRFQPLPNLQLLFAVNTNWPVFMDSRSSKYFLLDGQSWLTTMDPVAGPWVPTESIPIDQLSLLPTDHEWDCVRNAMPGAPFPTVPRVFTSTQPAELIVTDGPPQYSPINGTGLMYVSNPEMPLFMELATGSYYYLVAGRWFRGASVNGPWAAAGANLPGEFARIPADSPVASVLSSIPGTQQARDAVLLANVVHKATVNPATATVNVTYQGQPMFNGIPGTALQYAVNTSYQVIECESRFYCCYQAVWFESPQATGPWTVCQAVPPAIYNIPASCPDYNTTYVRVYDASPDAVVYGCTDGYSGEYVGPDGALVFGSGIVVVNQNNCADCWSSCSPAYYSYGCNAWYDCATGAYACGNACYGPHGGAGWASAYNPATGSWVRGGYACGPCGSYGVHSGYNATTDTWAAHASGHDGYESWGSSAVSQGDKWAQANHTTNANGVTHASAQDSSGASAQGVHYNNTSAAATSSGDLYAGHDGNAYRRTSDGTWETYNPGSGWQSTTKQPGNAQATASNAQQYGHENQATPGNAQQYGHENQASAGNAQQYGHENQASAGNAQQYGHEQQAAGNGGMQNQWAQHDSQAGLNQDAYSRQLGQSNSLSRSSGGYSGGRSFSGGRGRR